MVSGFLLPHVVDKRVADTVYDCFGIMIAGRHVGTPEGGGHEEEDPELEE